MHQVGHADSKMTMDVYAQLQQRVQRQHGQAFDALVRRARERLYGTSEAAEIEAIGQSIGQSSRNPAIEDLVDDSREEAETP